MKTAECREELRRLQAREGLAVLQIGTEDCGPCKAIRARLEGWLAEHPGVEGLYLPLEDFPEAAAELGIFTVPAVLVYAEGRLTLRETGCFSLEALFQRLERYLELMEG